MVKKMLALTGLFLVVTSYTVLAQDQVKLDMSLQGEINDMISVDLTGDQVEDLIVTTSLEGYVYLFRAKDEGYDLGDRIFIGSWVCHPTTGQLGSLGTKELVIADNVNSVVSLIWEDGLKIHRVSEPFDDQIQGIALGDLNGDGRDEVVVWFDRSLTVLKAQAEGFKTLISPVSFEQRIEHLLVAEGTIILGQPEQILSLTLDSKFPEAMEEGFLQIDKNSIPVMGIRINDTISPEQPLIRGDGIALAALAFKLPMPGQGCQFRDLSSTHHLAPLVAAACQGKLVSGYPDGTIRVGQPLTREEFLLILCRGAGLHPIDGDDLPWEDWGLISPWVKNYLHAPGVRRIIDSDQQPYLFRPQDQISWGEANQWLSRILSGKDDQC